MQYLLTKEEYDALNGAAFAERQKADRQIEEMCAMVAEAQGLLGCPLITQIRKKDTIGIARPSLFIPLCVEDEEKQRRYRQSHYCDACKAKNVCTFQWKEFSK